MKKALLPILIVFSLTVSCGTGEKGPGVEPADKKAVKKPSRAETGTKKTRPAAEEEAPSKRYLLVTQSRFKTNDKGKYVVPDAAVMLILKQGKGAYWDVERIEDTESNVFHKALAYGEEGILTIGGNAAMLKLWKKEQDGWKSETLWNPEFGGKHNRLRDFEMADFNKDGRMDLAIATHDQGVIAVVWRKGDKWEVEKLFEKKDTFVHEIETGDLDGDGQLEFYATPSQPNTVSGEDQGGMVMRFEYNGKKFDSSEVLSLKTRHIKEILVADVDGDKKQELYAALEAETEGSSIVKPVEIRRFDPGEGGFSASTVTTIDDRYCRFLVAGDIDGDGQKELVASAFSSGVWVIEKNGDSYSKKCINSKSGGFEHAAVMADLNEDGKLELYVADDRGGNITRYVYKNGRYESKVLHRRVIPGKAMVWNITDTAPFF